MKYDNLVGSNRIESREQSMLRLEALARLMDGAFVIPGTNIRMGLDGLIGLVPVLGDVAAGLVSTYLIWEARQLGAPGWLIARMLANTMLDTTIGAIPVVGDAFDILFRANMKNMALLRRHFEKQRRQSSLIIDRYVHRA